MAQMDLVMTINLLDLEIVKQIMRQATELLTSIEEVEDSLPRSIVKDAAILRDTFKSLIESIETIPFSTFPISTPNFTGSIPSI